MTATHRALAVAWWVIASGCRRLRLPEEHCTKCYLFSDKIVEERTYTGRVAHAGMHQEPVESVQLLLVEVVESHVTYAAGAAVRTWSAV